MRYFTIAMLFFILLPFVAALECNDRILFNEDDVANKVFLDQNLSCETDGLVISGNGVNLDCQGFGLSGITDTSGIVVDADDVIVTNCLIEGFGNGIRLQDQSSVILRNNTLLNNPVAFAVSDGSDILISENLIQGSTIGILHWSVDDLRNENNQFLDVITELQENVGPLFPVEEEEPPEPLVEEPVLEETVLTPVEFLNQSLQLEFALTGSQKDFDEEFNKYQETLLNVNISRSFKIDDGNIIVEIEIIPRINLINFNLYDRIPKCFASLFDDVELRGEYGYDVLEGDPLVVWHFPKLIKDRSTMIMYATIFGNEKLQTDCRDLFQFLATAERPSPFPWVKALIIVVLSFLVVVAFLYFTKKK